MERGKRIHEMDTQSSSKRIKTFDINDKDLISNLPDDLIALIFEQFDYDELDILSRVSRKMHHFASLAKQGIEKEGPKILSISQEANGDFVVSMQRNLVDSFMMAVKRNSNGTLEISKKRYTAEVIIEEMRVRRSGILTERFPVPAPIYQGAKYLLDRFNCETVVIGSVLIDDELMSTISSLTRDIENLNMVVHSALLKHGTPSTKRFLSWLVSLNTKSLFLSNISSIERSGEIYDWFIRELADNSPTSDVRIIYGSEPKGTISFPNEVPVEVIVKFAKFRIPDLVVDMQSLVKIVQKRIREKIAGNLFLHTHDVTEDHEFIEAFGDEFEVENVDTIELRDRTSRFLVSIETGSREMYFKFIQA